MMMMMQQQKGQDQNASMLQSFDFRAIQEQDPSLSKGHRVIYDREVPFEIRIHDPSSGPQEVGTLQGIRVRILVKGEEKIANEVRVELTSQNDLFFHYTHILNQELFKVMQQVQKLTIDFADYPGVLIKMLNSCIKDQHTFLGVFIMQRDGQSRLELIQNAEYKFIELLSIEFTHSPEQMIRNHISFRYSALKHKVTLMQTRLQDINNLIKVKNPSLLLQLQKGPVTVSTVNKSFR